MEENQIDLRNLLPYIPSSSLDYTQWVEVGMGLKEAGYSWDIWDSWSRTDSRYHEGECAKKWESFQGASTPITAGTIVQLAKENGWRGKFDGAYELSWDDIIREKDDYAFVDRTWLEGREIAMQASRSPVDDLIRYLELLFEASETVGYVTESWEKDGKYLPTKGAYDRTAGQLIQKLSKCGGDIGSVIGDYKEEAGAWIRFNPLDGSGVKNENVTEYRYALVESDTMELEKQNALIRELELPVICLVHSGKKSLHAIVKIEAVNYTEYRKRVDYLYGILKKNGMDVDVQNKNPSRLSRMPGVLRQGQRQYIIDENIGKESFLEWKEWIEALNDNLPDEDVLADSWDALPPLSPPLIDGILRQGHKMLLAGPSKAGKSYALIELACAIAEGKEWLGFSCTKGKVLYVNLELDRASCLHRFKDVYTALGWAPNNAKDLLIWNLRGKSLSMDKLAPKLVRRAQNKNYIAIIIDPIYKVITGDENSAEKMAEFCNQFDKVCTELGCAVIYCHHHSKGAQEGKKAMDRASGSGVFARDPDAMIDLVELDLTESIKAQNRQKAAATSYAAFVTENVENGADEFGLDDALSEKAMYDIAKDTLSKAQFLRAEESAKAAKARADARTAWQLNATLREFPRPPGMNLWFTYPIHEKDEIGVLSDLGGASAKGGGRSGWRDNFQRKKSPEERKDERKKAVETAFEACNFGGEVTIKQLSEYMGVEEKTVRNRLKEHGDFWIDDGKTGQKSKGD